MELTRYPGYRRWFEVALVVALIVLFMGIAASRFRDLRLGAEEVSVTRTLSALQVGLSNHAVVLAMHGDMEGIARLAEAEPSQLLDPGNGFETTDEPVVPETMAPGHWYYDRRTRLFIYRVDNVEALVTGLEPPARLRFRIQVDYTDADHNGRFDPRSDTLTHVTLVPVEPWHWKGSAP